MPHPSCFVFTIRTNMKTLKKKILAVGIRVRLGLTHNG
jgi:hypothetical protein